MIKKQLSYLLGVVGGLLLLLILYFLLEITSSDIILTITGVMVYIYCYETYRLRKATVANTEISIKPILVFDIDFLRRVITLQNFSNFPAYNLEFEKIEINYVGKTQTERGIWPGTFKLESIDIVPPKTMKEVQLFPPNKDRNQFFFSSMNPNISPPEEEEFYFKTHIIYDDILGEHWRNIIGYSSVSRIISGIPKRIERRIGNQKGGDPD